MTFALLTSVSHGDRCVWHWNVGLSKEDRESDGSESEGEKDMDVQGKGKATVKKSSREKKTADTINYEVVDGKPVEGESIDNNRKITDFFKQISTSTKTTGYMKEQESEHKAVMDDVDEMASEKGGNDIKPATMAHVKSIVDNAVKALKESFNSEKEELMANANAVGPAKTLLGELKQQSIKDKLRREERASARPAVRAWRCNGTDH
ncbi:hypothetical protein B0T20DRAFT_482988 [Sordaria brevicollis]|uniref:Uncharacterized protein n=1 Tax=Sordaria brevicollis TaxID=83679 RepID=A0AAE0P1S2_SORBR|nr:hypothetical protein B0T20DRAFT_482988 [Sordaria brevicollis]